MIDFRYHIVSLISVFLALAVGIALGAGPLKDTIGDTLTGQVKVLRAEKDGLRSSLDASNAELSDANAYVAAAAPAATPAPMMSGCFFCAMVHSPRNSGFPPG